MSARRPERPGDALRSGLSSEQLDAIDRFEADYNAIDHQLRAEVGASRGDSFAHVVREFRRRHRGWRDADLLVEVADLRNALVHGKREPMGYLAVPAPHLLAQLARCRASITAPRRAIPLFQREVAVVSPRDTLAAALKRIRMLDYSQFPIYDDGRFVGLLTENGITRWLAHRASTDPSPIALDAVDVHAIAKLEERRPNHVFVEGSRRADDLGAMFADQELLEAVLITRSGKASEPLLGIATRWDVATLAARPD